MTSETNSLVASETIGNSRTADGTTNGQYRCGSENSSRCVIRIRLKPTACNIIPLFTAETLLPKTRTSITPSQRSITKNSIGNYSNDIIRAIEHT